MHREQSHKQNYVAPAKEHVENLEKNYIFGESYEGRQLGSTRVTRGKFRKKQKPEKREQKPKKRKSDFIKIFIANTKKFAEKKAESFEISKNGHPG